MNKTKLKVQKKKKQEDQKRFQEKFRKFDLTNNILYLHTKLI